MFMCVITLPSYIVTYDILIFSLAIFHCHVFISAEWAISYVVSVTSEIMY